MLKIVHGIRIHLFFPYPFIFLIPEWFFIIVGIILEIALKTLRNSLIDDIIFYRLFPKVLEVRLWLMVVENYF